jgi:N-acetyl-anhydromuramyl-L-alanine amidase AmpD
LKSIWLEMLCGVWETIDHGKAPQGRDLRQRCSQYGRLLSTSEEALANTQQATRAFHRAFEGHNCDEGAGFQATEPS